MHQHAQPNAVSVWQVRLPGVILPPCASRRAFMYECGGILGSTHTLSHALAHETQDAKTLL